MKICLKLIKYIWGNLVCERGIIMIFAFFANGFEEVEAITPVDYLKRAGVDVVTVGVGNLEIEGAHGIVIRCDMTDSDIAPSDNTDGIILPGGMPGTINLEKNDTVQRFIDYCTDNNKMIAAICAAPSVLGHKGLLDGKKATCFPGFENDLGNAILSDRYAVCDGNIITAKGAGAASEFAFEIISYLVSSEKADEIRKTVQTCY